MYYYYSLPTPPAVPRAASWTLVANDWDYPQKEVSAVLEGGRTIFIEGGAGAFSTTTMSRPSLSTGTGVGGAQWIVRSPDRGYKLFDAAGLLIKQVTPEGKSTTYTRQGTSLTAVAASSGRSLQYSATDITTPQGFYDTIALPDGTALHYTFDATGLVGAVTHADGSQILHLYDEAAHTGTTDAKSFLTGLVDENGSRRATYTYSGSAPQSTGLAGGVGVYSFAFGYSYSQVTPPAPLGVSTLYWDTGPDGERRLTRWQQSAGAGSAAGSRALGFDANGNVASSDDFNGKRVCYANDLSRNLETARIEGLAGGTNCSTVTGTGASLPAGARKVSTAWHPDWRLQTKVAEPGRITSYVYNGQPDPFAGGAVASCAPASALLPDGKPIAVLCRQVEQATTDANGSLGFSATLDSTVANREQKWTYNQWGQVLSHDGPRTDVADITTYSYYSDTSFTGVGAAAVGHTIGDLQSVTNAAGKVTQYTKYDKHGQLLESVDPNGVVSTNSYDLRQRLLSTSVGGQTTGYTYDLAGQLKRVTRPDTSWIGFDYDPAHRQTAVYDNLGNRIEYTLDNAGNRTGESVKDTTGALRRQLARSIDALGRVQQTTGRE